jgi:hypothetical protein
VIRAEARGNREFFEDHLGGYLYYTVLARPVEYPITLHAPHRPQILRRAAWQERSLKHNLEELPETWYIVFNAAVTVA